MKIVFLILLFAPAFLSAQTPAKPGRAVEAPKNDTDRASADDPKAVIEFWQLVVSAIALVGTGAAAYTAYKSFMRTEAWKRAEFVAQEMKHFFADPRVQNALIMIDWGKRHVPLLAPTALTDGKVDVTRQMQIRALYPHTFLGETASDNEGVSSSSEALRQYSPEEAAIRDCYDAFLDGLERFSSYVQTNLIHSGALRPYLWYWIEDIHAPAKDGADAAWSAALLTYTAFYQFTGVQWLFRSFGKNIDPAESAYRGFLAKMDDQGLAVRFARSVGIEYTPQ
jgi:hypothetical protein